ncbi:MAG: hypothetical protein KGL73_02210 [Burkholderiales bacterium]|jgi:hypothetical protein|nr:hypothetical protein [Burkholderiales bacterium]
MLPRIVHIQALAPPKPALGLPCNGCGVCCLHEPCPLGILLSGRRRGACTALRWEEVRAQYRCGAMLQPREVLGAALPTGLGWLAPVLLPVLRRLAGRWIAAGQGCDCSLEVSPGQADPQTDRQSAP